MNQKFYLFKMRVSIACAAILFCYALKGEEPGAVSHASWKTAVVDGFYMVLINHYETKPTLWNEKVYIDIQTTRTQEVSKAWIPAAREYAYRLELIDSQSNSVPRTGRGKAVGRKFFELEVTPKLPSQAYLTMRTAYRTDERTTSFHELFRPSDYFEIERTGDYTLRVWLQMVGEVENGTNKMFKVIRFPPVDMPVRKPEGK